MASQKLRDRILEKVRGQFTKERLVLAGGFLKRKALEIAGRAILKRNAKGAKMKKYTLRLNIGVEATGRDVIEGAMGEATPHVYKYAPEALAFFNLNGSTRFCGFKSSVNQTKTKRRDPMKPFTVQVDLFLEAASKKEVEEPVDAVRAQVGQYASVILGFLGIADKVHYKSMEAQVLKGHA